jgi:hypothetical protein
MGSRADAPAPRRSKSCAVRVSSEQSPSAAAVARQRRRLLTAAVVVTGLAVAIRVGVLLMLPFARVEAANAISVPEAPEWMLSRTIESSRRLGRHLVSCVGLQRAGTDAFEAMAPARWCTVATGS